MTLSNHSNISEENDYSLAVVIPCYNEEERLPISSFEKFLTQQKTIFLLFVDDGSTDRTSDVLQKLKTQFPNVDALDMPSNQGKAAAVNTGMNWILENYPKVPKMAYLDADLATSLEECFRISEMVDNDIQFAFGSRILKLDTNVERRLFRFLIGRIIATAISIQLKLPVYDTQCGCKVFSSSLAKKIFNKPFISKWLFDVEIFHRIIKLHGHGKIRKIGKEVPLESWIDVGESKVGLSYGFKVWFDLFKIYKEYK